MTSAGWSELAYAEVARVVLSRTGLAFFPARLASVEAGIRRAMKRARVGDIRRYGHLVDRDADALDDLLIELTVGETYFFREPAHFAFIRAEILPEVRARHDVAHLIRAWSAGCASGEEAYSLAILFAEAGLADRVRLHATDISRAALAKARRAIYERWSLRGDGAVFATPYLLPIDVRYELDLRIRALVTIGYLNLALDTYPSFASGLWGMDLILCRNVLIYFDRETIAHVARHLFASLAEGGWLITGPSDPPLMKDAPFETITTDAGVFYRRPATRTVERASTAVRTPTPVGAAAPSPRIPATHPPPVAKPEAEADDPLSGARVALTRGEYGLVIDLTRKLGADAEASALCIRALANIDPIEAESACAAAAERNPFSPELQFLWSALLLDLGREEEAAKALRRVLYLDRSLAAAHFALAAIVRRRGDVEGARRAYRNARDLCASLPADAVLPLADGEHADRLAEAANVELALLEERRVG